MTIQAPGLLCELKKIKTIRLANNTTNINNSKYYPVSISFDSLNINQNREIPLLLLKRNLNVCESYSDIVSMKASMNQMNEMLNEIEDENERIFYQNLIDINGINN